MAAPPLFQSARADAEPAASLLRAMRTELSVVYDSLDIDAPDMPKAGPAELSPPHGDFVIGVDQDGGVLCGGGIKRLGDGVCEFKRIYVRPEARGRGVARQLLTALEDRAVELGYHVARLDTGPRQPHSRRLFEGAGYRPIGNFNGNPIATFFGEKRLTPGEV